VTWWRLATSSIAWMSLVVACACAPVREVVFYQDDDPGTGEQRSLVTIKEGSAQLQWQCVSGRFELYFRWGRWVEYGRSVSVEFEFMPEPPEPWPRGGGFWLSRDRRGGILLESSTSIAEFTKAALSSERVKLKVQPGGRSWFGGNPNWVVDWVSPNEVLSARELSLTGLSTELAKLPCYQGGGS